MAHLVTGYAGSEHIKSADDGSFNASFFGGGCFVMEAGNEMDASIIDNNTVRVLDGDLLMYGRHVRIEPNTYEDMTIETGTAGVKRYDLIVMEYKKNTSDGKESASLKVIKGTPSAGTPSVPTYTDGDILSGATLSQMPLYKLLIDGVVLDDVTALFDTVSTFKTTAEYYAEQFEEACEDHLDSLNILDTLEEVMANTQSNQLAGALALKGIGGQLVAEEGTSFNFAYDTTTAQYGWKDDDGEFHPFSNATKLYQALQYSGLVTPDMTFDEMCEVLAEHFPAFQPINIALFTSDKFQTLTRATANGTYVNVASNNSPPQSTQTSMAITKNIDVTCSKTITLSGVFTNGKVQSDDQSRIRAYNTNNDVVFEYIPAGQGQATTTNFDQTFTVGENFTGNIRFEFWIQNYAHYGATAGTSLKITKCLIQ